MTKPDSDPTFDIEDPADCAPDELQVIGQGINAALPDLDFPPDPKLSADGWERRFMADPTRTEEAIQLYTALGFEVHVAEIDPAELSELCGDCGLETCRAYVTLYTRKTSLDES